MLKFMGQKRTQKKENARNAYNVIGLQQPGNGISSLRPWSPAGNDLVKTICSYIALLESDLCMLVGLPILNHLQC